tara:strand:+ start:348 stop:593 length:246 start_codon:yes stop_codon:yes gene_type:complete
MKKMKRLIIEDGNTWWEQMIEDEKTRLELKQMIQDVNLLTQEEINNNEQITQDIIKMKWERGYVEYKNGRKVIQKQPFRDI